MLINDRVQYDNVRRHLGRNNEIHNCIAWFSLTIAPRTEGRRNLGHPSSVGIESLQLYLHSLRLADTNQT